MRLHLGYNARSTPAGITRGQRPASAAWTRISRACERLLPLRLPSPPRQTVADFAAQDVISSGTNTVDLRGPPSRVRPQETARKAIGPQGGSLPGVTPRPQTEYVPSPLSLSRVIAPFGLYWPIHRRRTERKPATWIPLDRHYETLRLDTRALFHDLGVAA